VGRTSVEAVGEDLSALDEVYGVDLAAVSEARGMDPAAVRRQSVRHGPGGGQGAGAGTCDVDLTMVGEVCGVDPVAVREAIGEKWNQWRSRSEALVMDPAVAREAFDEDPAVDLTAVGKAMAMRAWMQSMSGCTSGREMIVARVRV
jgi:hypothetical protein